MANEIKMVCDEMDMLAEDTTIPRNIRRSAQEAKNNLLNEKYALDVRCAGAMNVLSDLTGDSNMPMQAYTLILQILSQLEKISCACFCDLDIIEHNETCDIQIICYLAERKMSFKSCDRHLIIHNSPSFLCS